MKESGLFRFPEELIPDRRLKDPSFSTRLALSESSAFPLSVVSALGHGTLSRSLFWTQSKQRKYDKNEKYKLYFFL